MPALTLILPKPHTAQRRMLHEARRFNVAACGRRFGKSTVAEELAIRPMLSGMPVGWFTPTYKLLLETWRSISAIVAPVTRRVSTQERRIELITGGVLEFWTLEDPDAGRSRKYKRVIIDEAGLPAELGDRWEAAIRPTLADLVGDAWLLGTPKGRNFFWECFTRGQDATFPDWQSWQLPTSANPFIRPDEIEAMRLEMTERRFAQEVLAQFLEDAGGVFRNVAACSTVAPSPFVPGHTYVAGVDWGRTHDYTVISAFDATERRQVALERFTRIDYATQLARLRELVRTYQVSTVLAESNSMGGPLIEQLQREGLLVQAYQTTNTSKAVLIDTLSMALERQDVSLLNDPVQIAELQAYESERLPSGLLRYGAPEGGHDDTVIALALSVYAASQQSWQPADFAAFGRRGVRV